MLPRRVFEALLAKVKIVAEAALIANDIHDLAPLQLRSSSCFPAGTYLLAAIIAPISLDAG